MSLRIRNLKVLVLKLHETKIPLIYLTILFSYYFNLTSLPPPPGGELWKWGVLPLLSQLVRGWLLAPVLGAWHPVPLYLETQQCVNLHSLEMQGFR